MDDKLCRYWVKDHILYFEGVNVRTFTYRIPEKFVFWIRVQTQHIMMIYRTVNIIKI